MTSTTRIHSVPATKVYQLQHGITIYTDASPRKRVTETTHQRLAVSNADQRNARCAYDASDAQLSLPRFFYKRHTSRFVQRDQDSSDVNNVIFVLDKSYLSNFSDVSYLTYLYSMPWLFAWKTVQVTPWTTISHPFMSYSRQNRWALETFQASADPTVWNTRYPDQNRPFQFPARLLSVAIRASVVQVNSSQRQVNGI